MSVIKFRFKSTEGEILLASFIYLFFKVIYTYSYTPFLSRLLQDHGSVIKAIYSGSEFLESASAGNEVGIVLETTSFYAEQGGQVLCTHHAIQQ